MIYNLSALPARTDVDQGGPGKCKMYLSKLLNLFVLAAKLICPKCKMGNVQIKAAWLHWRFPYLHLYFIYNILVYILYLPALVLTTETFHKSWDCVCRLVSGWAERHFISEIYMMNICNLFCFFTCIWVSRVVFKIYLDNWLNLYFIWMESCFSQYFSGK